MLVVDQSVYITSVDSKFSFNKTKVMPLNCWKALVLLFILNLVKCRYVDIGSPVLDCVRIRNYQLRTLVFGTGFFHLTQNNQRYIATWDHSGTPYNSAFKIERISKFREPLYYIKMINTQEYLMGGQFVTSSDVQRIPVFSHHKFPNYTRDQDGVFGFEKAHDDRGALNGAWHIKNVHYDYYLIGSKEKSDPPSHAAGEGFHLLTMDRNYQPQKTKNHQFWIEQC